MMIKLTWKKHEGEWVSARGKYRYKIVKAGRWPNVKWTPMAFGRTRLRKTSRTYDGTDEWVEFNPRPSFKAAKEVLAQHATKEQEKNS